MSYRVIEKQIIYDGQKVRLELHRIQNDYTTARAMARSASIPAPWWCFRSWGMAG